RARRFGRRDCAVRVRRAGEQERTRLQSPDGCLYRGILSCLAGDCTDCLPSNPRRSDFAWRWIHRYRRIAHFGHVMMKVSAIIVAAGSRRRPGRREPKAFVQLPGGTVLAWSLATIAKLDEIVELVIAVPAGFESRARAEVIAANVQAPVKIAPGGAERQDSVRIALALTSV